MDTNTMDTNTMDTNTMDTNTMDTNVEIKILLQEINNMELEIVKYKKYINIITKDCNKKKESLFRICKHEKTSIEVEYDQTNILCDICGLTIQKC
jgi:hypothetical protein